MIDPCAHHHHGSVGELLACLRAQRARRDQRIAVLVGELRAARPDAATDYEAPIRDPQVWTVPPTLGNASHQPAGSR